MLSCILVYKSCQIVSYDSGVGVDSIDRLEDAQMTPDKIDRKAVQDAIDYFMRMNIVKSEEIILLLDIASLYLTSGFEAMGENEIRVILARLYYQHNPKLSVREGRGFIDEALKAIVGKVGKPSEMERTREELVEIIKDWAKRRSVKGVFPSDSRDLADTILSKPEGESGTSNEGKGE
jgi:hypothetical protein